MQKERLSPKEKAPAQSKAGNSAQDKKAEPERGAKSQPAQPVNSAPAPATTRYTSKYYYELCLKIWRLLLISLPLDFLLLLVDSHTLNVRYLTQLCQKVLLLLLLVVLASFLREALTSLVFALGETQGKLQKFSSKYSYLILAVVGALIFIEMTSKMGNADVISLLIAAVVTLGALKSIRESMRAKREHQEKLKLDRGLWIEEANYKVFWLTVLPLLAARLISPAGGLLVICQNRSGLLFLAYVFTSAFSLLELQPVPEHFMIHCRRCGQRTSRVLKSSGLCPRCEEQIQSLKTSIGKVTKEDHRGAFGIKVEPKAARQRNKSGDSWLTRLKAKAPLKLPKTGGSPPSKT